MIGDHELGARTRIADSVALPAWGTPGHPDQVIFETDLVTVGAFRCPVDHPLFRNTGPIHQSCVVFPRTFVRIEHETGPAILADPTLVTMYNAGQIVERHAISADGDRCDWYSVAPGILRDAVRTLDRAAADDAERVIRTASARSSSALYLRQRRLFVRVQTDRAPEPLEVEETVCSIVRDALASAYGRPSVAPRPGTPSRRKIEIAEAAKRTLATRFRSPMSLGAIAHVIGCTPCSLSRVFHDVTGMTLHRYRAALRLRASLELVEAGLPLTAVALDLGYSSHSHFTEAFRADFGVPPSQAAGRRRRHARV